MHKQKIPSPLILLFFSFIIILSLSIPAVAQDSLLINYQGRLTNSSGAPLDTTVMIMFSVYGTGEQSIWSESQSTTVTNGLFNVILGSVVFLPDTIFHGEDRYLGITVGSDTELSYRTLLTSVPNAAYAHHASIADTAGYVDGGVGITQFIRTDGIVLLNGYLYELAWDSINVPYEGYVMCQATVALTCDHVTGTEACVNLEFRKTISEHLYDQEHFWCLPPTLPTDRYTNPTNIHRVFPVIPGWNMFSLVVTDFRDAGSSFYADKVIMTLTYYPKAYGTVQDDESSATELNQYKMIPLDEMLREELIKHSLLKEAIK